MCQSSVAAQDSDLIHMYVGSPAAHGMLQPTAHTVALWRVTTKLLLQLLRVDGVAAGHCVYREQGWDFNVAITHLLRAQCPVMQCPAYWDIRRDFADLFVGLPSVHVWHDADMRRFMARGNQRDEWNRLADMLIQMFNRRDSILANIMFRG